MRKLIEKLHEKPESYRNNVALGVSAFLTLAVFGIWLSTSPFDFSNTVVVAKDVQQNLKDNITPLATVKASFDQAVSGFDKIKNLGQ